MGMNDRRRLDPSDEAHTAVISLLKVIVINCKTAEIVSFLVIVATRTRFRIITPGMPQQKGGSLDGSQGTALSKLWLLCVASSLTIATHASHYSIQCELR